MAFKTRYSKPTFKPSPAGSEEMMTYKLRLTKSGKKVLVEDKKINIYNIIQEDREEADLHTVINRAVNGDLNAIQRLQAQASGEKGIVDLTKMPNNLIEAKQMLIDADKEWLSLPLEVRQKYNNSKTEFLAAVENGEFDKFVKEKYGKPEPKVEKTTTTTTTTTTNNQGDVL